MENRWQPGENIVLRGIFAGRVWLAQSVIVVKDEDHETILLLLPGANALIPKDTSAGSEGIIRSETAGKKLGEKIGHYGYSRGKPTAF